MVSRRSTLVLSCLLATSVTQAESHTKMEDSGARSFGQVVGLLGNRPVKARHSGKWDRLSHHVPGFVPLPVPPK